MKSIITELWQEIYFFGIYKGSLKILNLIFIISGTIKMEDDKFEELIESVREGMAIINGEKLPSRSFQIESDYPNNFWKKIRIFFIRIFRFDSM